jgi:UDP-N-acetylmuramate dehydrogenase
MKPIVRVLLQTYSSLRIGGEADMVIVHTESELIEVLVYAKQQNLRVHVLGEGTNTYFEEDLKNLLIIKMELQGIVCNQLHATSYHLQAFSGENWDSVVKFSIEKGLWGIENLSLIPGTVGASPVQNIGAYGVELKDVFYALRAYDREEEKFVEFFLDDCQFGYRDSVFKRSFGRYVITSVTLSLSTLKNPTLTYKPLDSFVGKENLSLEDVRDLVVETRTSKLPDHKQYPNAGSFFKNPTVECAQAEGLRTQHPEMPLIVHGEGYKIPTAWLIEHIAHAKGLRVGNIGTWPNQPLVIVNYGDSTAEEVNVFAQNIIELVQKSTGITLEKEVNYIL